MGQLRNMVTREGLELLQMVLESNMTGDENKIFLLRVLKPLSISLSQFSCASKSKSPPIISPTNNQSL